MSKYREKYNSVSKHRYHTVSPDRLSYQGAIFRGAARLLVNGFEGKEVPKNAIVGYLVDEGGKLYSQTLGTITQVIMRNAEQINGVCEYRDYEYIDVVHHVPGSIDEREMHEGIVDRDFYALIIILR